MVALSVYCRPNAQADTRHIYVDFTPDAYAVDGRMGEEDIYHQVLFEKQSAQTRNNFDWNIPLLVFAAVLVFQLLVGG